MKLIEREAALATLWNLFSESLGGRGKVAVVSGVVATGKTALLRAFAERATGSGAVFLGAAASHAGQGVPLGVLMQLVRGAGCPSGVRDEVRRLLDEGPGAEAFGEEHPRPDSGTQVTGAVLEELHRIVLRMAERAPLVIGVDDVHHADPASLRFLLYIAHRLKTARVLVVLTERTEPWRDHPLFHADLLSRPHCRRIRLEPLSRHGQARLLATRLGTRAGCRLAEVCHAVTGGNPLLVQALLKDNRLPVRDAELTVDGAYQRAVTSCLHRGGPAMASIARALAILREPAAPALLGRLMGLDTDQVTETMDAMTTAGLLDTGRFRHPAARAAVLDGMAPEERAALHGRAARLLHDHGAAPPVVAAHLLAASRPAGTGPSGADPAAAGLTVPGPAIPGLTVSGLTVSGPAVPGTSPDAVSGATSRSASRSASGLSGIVSEFTAGYGERAVAEAVTEPLPVPPMGSAGGVSRAFAPEAGSWALPVLEEAAEQALADGDLRTALACLRLAHDVCPDEDRRAGVAGALARTEWRIDPTAVHRLLPALLSAAREGRLTGPPAVRLLGYLAWYGRTGEAIDVLGRLDGPGAAPARGPVREVEAARLLMSCFCPEAMDRAAPERDTAQDRKAVAGPANRQLRAAATLSAALTGAPGHDVPGVAEQVLQGARLGETPSEYVLAALAALVYDDRPDKAARWCDPLLEEAAARRDTVAHAALATARAVISLRQGELVAAERHARAALSRLSPAGWGVAIGLPLSVMVSATTGMDRYEDAATYLGVAVPEAMFQTPCGLHYLQARGHYRLATGHAAAALADFRFCGELARRWGFDVPGLVAWRADMARALIELGELSEAAALAAEQLGRLRPGPSRTRGITLYIQALTGDPADRRRLLREAVAVLEQSGDQYELALALGELSRTQRASGEGDLASVSARRARHLAERFGMPAASGPLARPGGAPAGTPASPVRSTAGSERVAPELSPAGPPKRRPAGRAAAPGAGATPARANVPVPELTEAERKVAALAAQGHTNRQIADTLLITVSTVEQHLTRVYRKLNVTRRADLRPELWSTTGTYAARKG
ncbi:AAA family ATPase [Actinomadura viridis]|uniref:helix-turn-helix transcriptional regulator n=1 Tax=Actinomadura viridis TaxID=58110 RepID=UPI0036950754